MTFEAHINEISKNVTDTLMYTNRAKNCFDKLTRILVVLSLMLTLLNYHNTIWGTTNITLIDAVQKLQNFAIKVADRRIKKYDHATPLFIELEWPYTQKGNLIQHGDDNIETNKQLLVTTCCKPDNSD